MKISKETDLYLFHDAKVGVMYYDYINKSINFHIFLDSPLKSIKGDAIIRITSIESVQLCSFEPWGKGIYITELNIEEKTKYSIMTILLNSGDTFIINARVFELVFENRFFK
ncbi:MAG: hypothetical protein RBR48_03220 [Bacilli bacterium]|jgi:hypothetical protein|nr:hypothetical protein [Bacilli bacterium]